MEDLLCEDCKYYKETYVGKGYCKLWDEYVKEYDSCLSAEEKD